MARKKKKKNKRKAPRPTGPTRAELADVFELYQKSVQAPEVDVPFFVKAYKQAYGHAPMVLREDFCGAAAVCCEWARSHRERIAYGVDLDPTALHWGREHNVAELTPKQRARVQLVQGDVRDDHGPAADVIAAQNFSFNVFQTREALRGYFEAARRHLHDEGLLVLDVMGGGQAQQEDFEESRRVGKATYVWEQERFDPLTHRCLMHIHFRFKDGSEIPRAFTYDWRLWTIPELRELLLEAGFGRAQVYWEGTDEETGDGNGVYDAVDEADSDPSWIAYVVGIR